MSSTRIHTPDPSVLAALTGHSASLERAASLRTRRAVYNAALAQRASRSTHRRNVFLAVAIVAVLILMALPAIWSGVEEMIGGGNMVDLPMMLAVFGTMMLAAMASALYLIGSRRANARDIRRQSR